MNKGTPHFLLLHGSWMGGWSWDAVRAGLDAAGYTSSAPTLEGLDPDAEPARADISLGTHIAQALAHVDQLAPGPVVTVGHSYGALVAAAIADRRRSIVRQLIVLDGFLPESGKSVFDLRPDLAAVLRNFVLDEAPTSIQIPPAAVLGLDDSAAALATRARMRAMPLATHDEALLLDGRWSDCARHYILFAQCPFFVETAQSAATQGWSVDRIEAPHLAILTDAPAVVRSLIQAVSSLEASVY